jgi:hypothetical protein
MDPDEIQAYVLWKFRMVALAGRCGCAPDPLSLCRVVGRSPVEDLNEAEEEFVRFCRELNPVLNSESAFGTITAEAAEKSEL